MSIQKLTDNGSVYYQFNCPHCGGGIRVQENEICCQIFRHAQYKNNGQQIPPHSSKVECDRLIQENLVHGCAKPFRFTGTTIEICDYI